VVRAWRIGIFGLLAGVIAVPFGGASLAHGTSPSADLFVASVSASQRVGTAGLSLRILSVVRNAGSAAAPPSTTGYYLSRDRKRDGGDARLGVRSTAALRSGASSRRTVTLPVPASVKPGAYRVLVCADATNRVREPIESDNCTASGPLRFSDRTPPAFSGLKSAVTCIPGPVGESRQSSYRLEWDSALDNVTPTSKIVYDVYQATTEDGEDFTRSTYVSAPGATSLTTPPLPSDRGYFFVVRARDRAGNRDKNRVERPGQNLCL
jgi:CARDB